MDTNVFKLTSFPNGKNGGNPAGVVIDADGLTDTQMQAIAEKVGFSETAFVSKSDKADFRVRFFTPTDEVDLCGHATIATFNLLRDKKKIKKGLYTQETRAGILSIDVQKNMVFMEQKRPIFFETVEEAEIYECFYEERFIEKTLPIIIVSTGIREIFLPVKTVEQLHKLNPKLKHIKYISEKYDVIGIHAFALGEDKVDAYGRNFAPLFGIDEESATGTSNGALGCYINKYVDPLKLEFKLRQGYSMNMPSEITTIIEKELSEISKVTVGGTAKLLK